MRRRMLVVVFTAAVVAIAHPSPAVAKDFRTLVVVGAGGESTTLRPRAGVLDSFMDPGHPLNRGRTHTSVAPRGRYVLLYLLVVGGLPGIPGRYYPDNDAACFDWSQIGPHPLCERPNRTLVRMLRPARQLPRLRGDPTVLSGLRHRQRAVSLANLRVAANMTLARSDAARRLRSRPQRCVAFEATWRGTARRPRSFCLAPAGIWVQGLLYPLGRGVWEFARENLPRARRGGSASVVAGGRSLSSPAAGI